MSSSSRLRYLWSISHSICSLIIFFWGMNMFLRISTSSVWRAAFVIRFLIFMIFTIASYKKSNETNENDAEWLLNWTNLDCDRRVNLNETSQQIWNLPARSKKGTIREHCGKLRPQLADFFSVDLKIFNCRLLCGEFRQVCDKIGARRAISDSARSQNVLSGLVG